MINEDSVQFLPSVNWLGKCIVLNRCELIRVVNSSVQLCKLIRVVSSFVQPCELIRTL